MRALHPARSLRSLVWSSALLAALMGCGREPAAPSPSPPAASAPSPAAAEPSSVPPVAPPPEPSAPSHLAFAGDDAWPTLEVQQLPVRIRPLAVGSSTWQVPVIAHPDRAVRRALDREIRSAVRAWARDGGFLESSGACDAVLAHPALVSVACRAVDGYLTSVSLGPLQWAIEGSTLRPLRTEEVLIDGADLDALHVQRCDGCGPQRLAVGPYGLVQLAWDKLHEIPYPAIRSLLRPDGALAQVLPGEPSATGDATAAEGSVHGWTVASFDTDIPGMVLWWAALDEDVRSRLDFVITSSGKAHAIVPDDHARSDAFALAVRYAPGPVDADGRPSPMIPVSLPSRITRGRTPGRLDVVRAGATVELRNGPAARWEVRAVFPSGALGYSLTGRTVEGLAAPSRGWSYVIVPGVDAGWAPPRTLSSPEGCDPAQIIEQTRSAVQVGLGRYETTVGMVELAPGERRAFVIAHSWSRGTRIAIFALDEECRAGAQIAVAELEGAVRRVEIARVDSRPWMMVETLRREHSGGTRRWTALVDWSRIAWTGDLPTSHDVAPEQRARVTMLASGDTLATIETPDGARTRLVITGGEVPTLEARPDREESP